MIRVDLRLCWRGSFAGQLDERFATAMDETARIKGIQVDGRGDDLLL
jgi:hypothetical protein